MKTEDKNGTELKRDDCVFTPEGMGRIIGFQYDNAHVLVNGSHHVFPCKDLEKEDVFN